MVGTTARQGGLEQINRLKQELDSLRPLPAAAVHNLEEVFRVEWTYNSNAIEGNNLTLLVLEQGLTIGGKKLREHFEVINHAEAIQYVQDLVQRKQELTEHVPPHYTSVPEQMEQLMRWYVEQRDVIHPVLLAAEFHFRFVYIHPFSAGNGRTARLLMNLILMEHGYPPAIVKVADAARLRYYETWEETSVQGHLQPFVSLIMECVAESLQAYLFAVK
ncbi:Fic family protein [Paenibacillus thiaminolyticus]|uniref:Fic family protein n=1 Tax=Paenibacillus thiaminolyticus TaxID=49283 RepID=UPI0035A5CC1B